jgi:hypothetical protein
MTMSQITTTEQLSEHVAKIIATYSDKDDGASDFAVGYRLGYLAVQMLCTLRKPLPGIIELLREKSLMQMFPQRQDAESARGSVAAFTHLLSLLTETEAV